MNIKIKGNSGCCVEVIWLNGKYAARKTISDNDYIPRLRKQKEKQELFYQRNTFDYLIIPKVLGEYHDGSTYGFCMDYYNCNDYITHLQLSSKREIDLTLSRIISFIENSISSSTIASVKKEFFLNKYENIRRNIMLNPLLPEIDNEFIGRLDKAVLSIRENIELPLGPCHGDLTFSNMLFSGESLVLIDFLDNFIETPLQDIVKIRQDACYNWSLNLFQSDYDRTKILIIMKYIDDAVHAYFMRYKFYAEHYSLLQFFNFLRIIPYSKTPLITQYLKDTMLKIISACSLDL
ncbi:phosphotransferase [Candidatus Magnetominusculus xianensis]|uniref:Aminoglycoside phosphotransferase domain-containing protein n=1 Tax=Candidatus Magnetominusculus xianensis TaxID=1748249 RepID=A0ABR5SE40_9BACT|nr:phosphotransferase [Candidatus Magnetominusculus xianensis]KWT82521.1 hypothetical protein ASN18_2463 [Candidatus Magnetominusculus xianensis]MBF0405527.1 phosphotransferase [Nitrospirota bacterium]